MRRIVAVVADSRRERERANAAGMGSAAARHDPRIHPRRYKRAMTLPTSHACHVLATQYMERGASVD